MSNQPFQTSSPPSQLESLRRLLTEVHQTNAFYQQLWNGIRPPEGQVELATFQKLYPLLTKSALTRDQELHPPFGSNFTYSIDHFTRCHQTSGTSGKPIRWLDTNQSWSELIDQWVEVFRAAGVQSHDAVFCAFSFGPFLGFWLAFEAATRMGCLTHPGGGLSSIARLHFILESGSTVLCCTPTYALRLAQVADDENIDLKHSKVRLIIVAGEPGGSVPATRNLIQSRWPGTRVFDHHGMTEVGPVTYECPNHVGRLHILDHAYLSEVIDPETHQPVPPGEVGELVLTTLLRVPSPAIRYRTGDLVRLHSGFAATQSEKVDLCTCGSSRSSLEGGILGRADQMVVVRGVNVYPSAIESLVRALPNIGEYAVNFSQTQGMLEMQIQIEGLTQSSALKSTAAELADKIKDHLNLRAEVICVDFGTLPRFEMKAKRWNLGSNSSVGRQTVAPQTFAKAKA